MDSSTALESTFGFDSPGQERAEALLEVLRPPNATSVPSDLIVHTPLSGAGSLTLSHPFDRAIYESASRLADMAGKVIAFDLDDTLLNTNYICKENWTFSHDLGQEPETQESINYSRLWHPVSYWIRAGWRRPRRMQFDSSRYTFLRNPDVVAQLRPGALALLHGLKAAGATLVLMTVSARQRLEFLFSRLPALRDAFRGPHDNRLLVASAQDLADFALALNTAVPPIPSGIDADMEAQWTGGLQAHRIAPRCFNVKTLPALHAITGLKRLDLLVDDSTEGAERFARCGLSDIFLQAVALDPHSPVVLDLLHRLIARFGWSPDGNLEPGEGRSMLADAYPWIRFEDPFYFPLVHKMNEFEPTHERSG